MLPVISVTATSVIHTAVRTISPAASIDCLLYTYKPAMSRRKLACFCRWENNVNARILGNRTQFQLRIERRDEYAVCQNNETSQVVSIGMGASCAILRGFVLTFSGSEFQHPETPGSIKPCECKHFHFPGRSRPRIDYISIARRRTTQPQG